jgi:type IV secretion system protein TrbL
MMLVNPTGPIPTAQGGCAWWNLVCQGGNQVVDSGLSAITRATANGANQLLGEIVRIVDESTQVPLTDPTYQRIYAGFLGLAAPLMGVVLCGALIVAALRRDPGTLGRAVSGLFVAGMGGALYIVLAQLLVALDNWLAHGIVRVTGRDLTDGLTDLADGFAQIGNQSGEIAANMLMIVLMLVMLLAGIILWFVLVFRKIAILVVVAFAPLLIAGYLWAPTRPWVRRATEVLVALVFTKSAIYALFGIGLALLARGGGQSLSDFVGAVVLLCGACFTPMLMLRLVHFAADAHVAGDMMGTLRGGVQPVLSRLPHGFGTPSGRHENARQSAQGPTPEQARSNQVTTLKPDVEHATDATPTGASGAGAAGAGAAVLVAQKSAEATRGASHRVQDTAGDLTRPRNPHSRGEPDEPPLHGPPPPSPEPPTRPGPDGGHP